MKENEKDREQFKRLILSQKEILKWTNQEFADHLKVSINTASHWLHGTYMPKGEKKENILNVLKIAIDKL